MATDKKRVQTFLEDPLFEALSEYANTHEVSISQGAAKILREHLLPTSEQLVSNSYYDAQKIEERFQELEEQVKDLYSLLNTLTPPTPLGEQSVSIDESLPPQEEEILWVICETKDKDIMGYWTGKEFSENLDEAQTYTKESGCKAAITKLIKNYGGKRLQYTKKSTLIDKFSHHEKPIHKDNDEQILEKEGEDNKSDLSH